MLKEFYSNLPRRQHLAISEAPTSENVFSQRHREILIL